MPAILSHGLTLLEGEHEEVETEAVHVSLLDGRLAGTWIKDVPKSDPMEAACTLLQLNGVVRIAIALLRGVSIEFNQVPGAPSRDSSGPAAPVIVMRFSVFSVMCVCGWSSACLISLSRIFHV